MVSTLTTFSFVFTLRHAGFEFDPVVVMMFLWSAPLLSVAVLLIRAGRASTPDLQARRELIFWRVLVVYVIVSAAVMTATITHSLARH